MKKNSNLSSLFVLVKRNIKVYMNDKITVFFSVLAPVIVLLLYILFLGELQVNSIMSSLKEAGLEGLVQIGEVKAVINNWMISGVMGVSCITVAFNANNIMVRDRERGNINDVLASPIKRWVVYASYIVSCFIITMVISLIMLGLSLIYLAATHGLLMNIKDFFAILGITVLSVISASFAMVLLISFFKTAGALGAFSSIFTAAIGFLIGAYLPTSMLPKAIQYLTCFIPGTYSAGLFRNYLLRGPMEHITKVLPDDFVHNLKSNYSISMEFFGTQISAGWMVFALVLSIVLFGALLVIFYSNKRTNFFFLQKKHKKAKKKAQ